MAGAAADDEVAAVRHAEGEDGFGVGVVGGSTMDYFWGGECGVWFEVGGG